MWRVGDVVQWEDGGTTDVGIVIDVSERYKQFTVKWSGDPEPVDHIFNTQLVFSLAPREDD